MSSSKVLLCLPDLNKTSNFNDTFLVKTLNMKLHKKIHPAWAQLLHADKRTDRYSQATFHNSTKEPPQIIYSHTCYGARNWG